ncbi:MAG: DUF4783 domain-containing protein [Ignavibacteriales bacterium]|nr:DUF4783 domain-containing protein [Ignavibacteriales bacterium]
MNKISITLSFWVYFWFMTVMAFAQPTANVSQFATDARKLIALTEIAIKQGEMNNISSALGREVTINIRNGESGLFSSNQSVVILQNYFSTRRIVQFAFTTKQDDRESFYATGGGIFSIRGRREHFQIYVGLTIKDGRLVISQFNVY